MNLNKSDQFLVSNCYRGDAGQEEAGMLDQIPDEGCGDAFTGVDHPSRQAPNTIVAALLEG